MWKLFFVVYIVYVRNIVLVHPVWTICLDRYIFVWASLRSEGYNSACHGKQKQVWTLVTTYKVACTVIDMRDSYPTEHP